MMFNEFALFAPSFRLLRREAGGSYGVRVSLVRTALWLAELGIFDRDYATKTAGSNPVGLVATKLALIGVSCNRIGKDNRHG